MPIIPRYDLTQSSTHVNIELSIPHVRVSTSTLDLVIVDGAELHLYAPPTYLLKLTLPGRVVDEDAVEESLTRATTGSDAACVVEAVENCSDDVDSDGCQGASSTSMTSSHLWTKEDLPKLQYNPEKNHGTLVVILRKEEEGFWHDLDLLGRLQQPTAQRQQEKLASPRTKKENPLVQVIDADDDQTDTSPSEVTEDLVSSNNYNKSYGLFQNFSNVFRDFAREGLAHDMLECPNPDEVYASAFDGDEERANSEEQNRRGMRLAAENEKFDSNRYLNDLFVEEEGDMVFDAAIMMVPHWMEAETLNQNESVENVTRELANLSTSENQKAFFTSEESHLLATLPSRNNNQVQLSAEQKRAAYLTLTDILFAYAYDHRTTDGDPTVESSWTVMILSPSLAWLENYYPPYDSVADVVRWSIRRSLIHPYLRSYALARAVVEDVCLILKAGRRTVIRCLLQLHRIMERSESHYLFNKLYIGPLISWIQLCEEDEVQHTGREIEGLLVDTDLLSKQWLGLDLVELEKDFFENDYGDASVSSEDHD